MLYFIGLNLLIAYLELQSAPFKLYLISSYATYLSYFLATAGLILKILWPESFKWRLELYALASLLYWNSSWRPFFNVDAPFWFFFPLYFALFNAGLNLLFSNSKAPLDGVSLFYLQKLNGSPFFGEWAFVLALAFSLTQVENFLLYPTVLSLLIIKFVLVKVLEEI